MCKITKSLKAILDPDNPEDKKILLLAELIEDMRDTIYSREDKMQEDITDVKEKVENLSDLASREEALRQEVAEIKQQVETLSSMSSCCPMLKNTQGSKFIGFIVEYPKVSIAIVLMVGLLLGATSGDIADFIIKIISQIFR
jgi:hypothetical protein